MTAPETVEIAIVVPWGGDRLDLLLAQLDRLTAQDANEPLHIRVAVNRQVPRAVAQTILARSTDRRAIEIIDATSRRGPAHARNRGAHPLPRLLLFCDADDEADGAWARQMSYALRSGADLVGGVLDYKPLNSVPFALSRAHGLPSAFRFLPFTPSASLGIKSSIFADLGGFDEDLPSGEDIDLCWRAQYAGHTIAFVPRARVAYRLRQTSQELFAQGRRYGIADLELYRRHHQHGLTRSPADMVGEFLRIAVLLALAPRNRASRLKLAAKLGTVVGHLEGSLQARKLFL
jgi:GT2 family glycosyltransferase